MADVRLSVVSLRAVEEAPVVKQRIKSCARNANMRLIGTCVAIGVALVTGRSDQILRRETGGNTDFTRGSQVNEGIDQWILVACEAFNIVKRVACGAV